MARSGRVVNVAVSLAALLVSLGLVELGLRYAFDPGLDGEKVWVGDHPNARNPSLDAAVAQSCREFPSWWGNCYPTDPTGLLPITTRDPLTGRTWHCVAYDLKSRATGYDPDREYQAAIVGDSFAFGEGVKETDTLGYLLNRKYPRVNFRTYADSGMNIGQVEETCSRILLLAPAVRSIVYVYNLNDVLLSREVGDLQKVIVDFQNLFLHRAKAGQGPIAAALERSKLYVLLRKAWVVRRESALATGNYQDMYLSEANRSEFFATMDVLKGINETARARGVSFAVVVHPLLNKDLFGRYPFEGVHAAIMAACRERGVPCLDGYEAFRDFSSFGSLVVNPLDYHPNGRSNRILADYIRGSGFLDDSGRVE
jgi:hypothetical protein